MRIFVTGGTGFIGSAVVRELLGAGHEVLGLARSNEAAATLAAAGADAYRGALDDLATLRNGAEASDGVIHTAFNNIGETTDFTASTRIDREAIEAIGEALAGSGRPFVITSGTGLLKPGTLATEDAVPDPASPAALRIPSEAMALSFADWGVRMVVLRLPPSVHGEGDHGFVPALIEIARAAGMSGYPGNGANRWATVHRLDAARLFRLALESAPAGARLHGVGEEGVRVRVIAEVIGRRLNLPVTSVAAEDAPDHFGWLTPFITLDAPASSSTTQHLLGWQPEQPGLFEDLEQEHYYAQQEAAAPAA
jgi:nucleoside-diphosphate-sugar epimerase